jgi:hypothetical protein
LIAGRTGPSGSSIGRHRRRGSLLLRPLLCRRPDRRICGRSTGDLRAAIRGDCTRRSSGWSAVPP